MPRWLVSALRIVGASVQRVFAKADMIGKGAGMEDRCCIVPTHKGYSGLPAPLCSVVSHVTYATGTPARIAIDADQSNCQKTHLELRSDALSHREITFGMLV